MALKTPCIPASHPEALKIAADTLYGGGIVAYPTETFYGLGVRFDNRAALERLFTIKERPSDKAFPLIIGRFVHLNHLTHTVHKLAHWLARRYWPGPLTILFKARKGLPPYIVFDEKIAIRMPGESFALSLARLSDCPMTSTSANISGMPPASDAMTVASYFLNQLDLIVDGGKTAGTLPSTIVDATGGDIRIVRSGALKVPPIDKRRLS